VINGDINYYFLGLAVLFASSSFDNIICQSHKPSAPLGNGMLRIIAGVFYISHKFFGARYW
jgi:hypothetical protein